MLPTLIFFETPFISTQNGTLSPFPVAEEALAAAMSCPMASNVQMAQGDRVTMQTCVVHYSSRVI